MSTAKYVDELQLITGIDIPVKELSITLRQPRVKEIAMLTEQQYFVALSIFNMTKESLKIEAPEATNWKIFNETIGQKIDGVDNPRTLVTNFMRLFSPHPLNFGPRGIIIDINDQTFNINEENFDLFQKVICELGGSEMLSGASEEKFKPINSHAAQIAQRMKETRAKKAALQPKVKTDSFLARYVRAVATMTSNSIEDVRNMTLYQLNEIMQTYLSWEAYDLEIKSRLAGAKGDKKLNHWTVSSAEADDRIGTI